MPGDMSSQKALSERTINFSFIAIKTIVHKHDKLSPICVKSMLTSPCHSTRLSRLQHHLLECAELESQVFRHI